MLAYQTHTARLGTIRAIAAVLLAGLSIVTSQQVAAQSQVLAWGDNLYGQCSVPSQIGNQIYSKIGAGDRHTVGLRVDGSIDTWGDNSHGQRNVHALPPGITYVDMDGAFEGTALAYLAAQ